MKKALLRISLILVFTLVSLVIILLFPQLTYAKATTFEQTTIYHNQPLPRAYKETLTQSLNMVKHAKIYNQDFSIDICLDDGSFYPRIMEKIQGPAFGYGYANKVVISSQVDFAKNKAFKNDRSWHLITLIAHEMLHCYQYDAFGFSTLNTPIWKLEGYPEYIIHGLTEKKAYKQEKEIFCQATQGKKDYWPWIESKDGNGIPATYFQDRLRIQYLMEEKGMTYHDILASDVDHQLECQAFVQDSL